MPKTLDKIEECRRTRLQELAAKYGSIAKLAENVDVTPGYISQLLNKRRPITEKTARKIESALGLAENWLDYPDNQPTSQPEAPGGPGNGNVEPGPDITGRIPLISWTTAGNWGEIVDNFHPGDAEEWISTTTKTGPHAFALRIRGESMLPTIPDGAVVIVDPDTQARHRSIVIVRQNHDTEATCKRLIYEGEHPMIRPDNSAYSAQISPLAEDAVIVGVVRQVIVDLE